MREIPVFGRDVSRPYVSQRVVGTTYMSSVRRHKPMNHAILWRYLDT